VVRIGLVSDSWGDAPSLARALLALDQVGAERTFFLGGRWADAEAALASPLPAAAAARIGTRLVRVASRSCPERASGAAPGKAIEMVAGALGYLVHDKADLTRDEIASATFLLHGAADAPGLVRIGPRFFVTPGRLTPASGGGGAPALPVQAGDRAGVLVPGSWALLEVVAPRVELVVYGADGKERIRLTEEVPPGAQVKIR